jgi:hypothetical protein
VNPLVDAYAAFVASLSPVPSTPEAVRNQLEALSLALSSALTALEDDNEDEAALCLNPTGLYYNV